MLTVCRRRCRAIGLIAIAAILLNAAAPLLNLAAAAVRGLPSSSSLPWLEICTSVGLERLAAPAGRAQSPAEPAPPARMRAMHECCTTHCAGAMLLDEQPRTVAVDHCAQPLPQPSFQATGPRPVWTAARPRAPPALT